MKGYAMAKKGIGTQPKIGAQSEVFVEAARSLGCDEDPAHFDKALKKVARHKPDAGKSPPTAAGEKEKKPK
jgi:hypothetical protein